ncbi:MAG: hypothetical protein ACYDAY_11730 [Candidatus Dormibacteria bacterium]
MFRIALAGTLVALALLHFARLADAPPGFFSDEAAVGYSAWSVALTGSDEHAHQLPVYFESFGDYKNPVLIYAEVPVMWLFGPSVTAVRAVSSGFSLLGALAVALLAQVLFRRRWFSLAAFGVTGVVPWMFVAGRIGFEVAALPACLTAFLVLWRRAETRWLAWQGALAGLALGLTVYSYSTARLFVPLLAVAVAAVYGLHLWTHRSSRAELWRQVRTLAAFAGALGVSFLPLLVWSLRFPGSLTARFGEVSITGFQGGGDNSPLSVLSRFWQVYTSSFSFDFLFYTGDPWGRHNSGHGGVLFVTLMPLMLMGIVGVVRRWREPFWRMIALGLALAPVPAALTVQFGHSLRLMEMLPFLAAVILLGAHDLLVLLPGRRWLPVALIAAIGVEAVSFMSDYFSNYPQRQVFWFQPGMQEAMDFAFHLPGHPPVAISDHIDHGGMMYAFFEREDPHAYQRNGVAALGAVVEPVSQGGLSTGVIVVAPADQNVPGATLIRSIGFPKFDQWGTKSSSSTYSVWRVN